MNAMHRNPKSRIKMLVTKMQTKLYLQVKDKITTNARDNDDRDNGSKRVRCGKHFSRKSVGSIFSCGLGNKRSPCRYSSLVKKKGFHGDSRARSKQHVTGRASRKELENRFVREDEPVEGELSQLLALEDTWEPGRAVNRKHKRRVKMNLPLLRFLDKKKGCLRRFVRIPSKILVIRLKLKIIRSLVKNKVTKRFEQKAEENADEDNDWELCKKRILMGGRCKPLCSSGTLSYDTNGLLLPEIFTPRHPLSSSSPLGFLPSSQ